MDGTLDIVDKSVWITKCYRLGIQDRKAKPMMGEFSMTAGSQADNMEAWLLRATGGGEVLPRLRNVEMVGWYANGFMLRGYCYETLAGSSRKFYCEWFVCHGAKWSGEMVEK